MIGTLNLYLMRRFALWLVIVTLGFGTVAMLGDFLEMLRFANRFNLGAGTAFNFTLHRLPLLLMDFLPFIFLFGSVFFTCYALAKHKNWLFAPPVFRSGSF